MSTLPQSGARRGGGVAAGIVARAMQVGIMFLLIAVLLFAGAGTIDWTWGWLYLLIYLLSVLVNAWFLRRRPELIAERGRPAASAPTWDRLLGGLWAIALFVLLPLVAGLDLRFGWTGPVDAAWHLLGTFVFVAGLGLFGWAMIVNAFFSTVARVQPDRGQAVCQEGPYRFVRHPGYVGAILESIGSPLLLGSAWALLPAVMAVVCMVVRTSFEDRMLHTELPGYAEYSNQVRHRLVPLIW